MSFISEDYFLTVGLTITNHSYRLRTHATNRKFRAFFGIPPSTCFIIWGSIKSKIPPGCTPKHLLFGLLFLKVYASEHIHAALCSVSEKTFRKWAWVIVHLVSDLRLVSYFSIFDIFYYHEGNLLNFNNILFNFSNKNQITLSSRFENCPHAFYRCHISVDGVDFMIYEPQSFSDMWYSHKFKGPGLRYEIGVCIFTSQISWANGPFPCGRYNDNKIYQCHLKEKLQNNEVVVADDGYTDHTCIQNISVNGVNPKRILARHENLNRRMKQFNILGHRFRHDKNLHQKCFFAVLNIVQILIRTIDPLFDL